MNGDIHAGLREQLEVKFLRLTRPFFSPLIVVVGWHKPQGASTTVKNRTDAPDDQEDLSPADSS